MAEINARYIAMGELVDAASSFEMGLRSALCALIGSKYAAIIVAGRMAGELIDNCTAITKKHREISEPAREQLVTVLSRAKVASERRNRLIHDVWVHGGPNGSMLMRSKFRDHSLPVSSTSVDAVQETTQALREISAELHQILTRELGMLAATIESQLRWEEHVATMTPDEIEVMNQRRRRARDGKDEPVHES